MGGELERVSDQLPIVPEKGYEQKEEGFEGLGPPPDGYVRVVIDYPADHQPQINTRRDQKQMDEEMEAALLNPHLRGRMQPPIWWTMVLDARTGEPCEGTLRQLVMSKATVEEMRARGMQW